MKVDGQKTTPLTESSLKWTVLGQSERSFQHVWDHLLFHFDSFGPSSFSRMTVFSDP